MSSQKLEIEILNTHTAVNLLENLGANIVHQYTKPMITVYERNTEKYLEVFSKINSYYNYGLFQVFFYVSKTLKNFLLSVCIKEDVPLLLTSKFATILL